MNGIRVKQLATALSEADLWGCESEADRIYRRMTGTEDSAIDQEA